MRFSDIKYFLAYIIPLTCLIGMYLGGLWNWLCITFVFFLLPTLEIIIPLNRGNEGLEEEDRKIAVFFDCLLLINLPLLYFTIFKAINIFNDNSLTPLAILGLILSIGTVMGSNGINVAHELGHKQGYVNQIFAKLLLIPSLYTHFTLQHNRGHHLNVGTPLDPATAIKNESVYSFWWRCIPSTFLQAIALERKRLNNASFPSIFKNEMFLNILLSLFYCAGALYIYNWRVLAFLIGAAFVSVLLLETINYIEHYGLSRKLLNNGRYAPVNVTHSWNSNHMIGRIVLFELTRHADHHYKASKKYQTLLHYDDSPQLPYGYPGSIVLALFPRLWYKIMNPRVERYQKHSDIIIV